MKRMTAEQHYDSDYFDWQKNIGAFGGVANLIKFEPFLTPDDRVVDFGCGGGFLLANMNCQEKVGVEVNPTARQAAEGHGLKVVASLAEISDGWASLIVSNHALEHVEHPFAVASEMLRVLEPGGRVVIVVPCDHYRVDFDPSDINQHLYSWSPMNLGNLFKHAGFEVEQCGLFIHTWPRRYEQIVKRFGWRVFHALARLQGRVETRWKQVRLVARKPPAV
ncbi:class I SAM-dependent methyltransferase [Rhodospira trueperi]|nr:methyltransferase domain-containing protein [Rhodospira trueperi]